MYSNVPHRYTNHIHLGQKIPSHVLHSPQLNHALPTYQQHISHATTTSVPAINSIATSVAGQVTGPHHQKQVDSVLLSRQAASPHHHARVAAAAARTAMSNPDANNASNGTGVDPSAKPSEWTILDLGGMQMKNLSRELFGYAFLTTLYLNHNAFTMLSPLIAKLTNLVVLDLSGNRLSSLPSELGMVVSLKELLLHDNELTFLPADLGQLYQLETLGLEGNPLNEPVLSMIQKEGTTTVITYLREMCPGEKKFPTKSS